MLRSKYLLWIRKKWKVDQRNIGTDEQEAEHIKTIIPRNKQRK